MFYTPKVKVARNLHTCVVFRNVDFGDILTPEVKQRHPYTTYDLVANIVHDGEPGQGTYRVHILHRATGQWYELQDLHVTQILPQMITLTEAYIQVCIACTQMFIMYTNIHKEILLLSRSTS